MTASHNVGRLTAPGPKRRRLIFGVFLMSALASSLAARSDGQAALSPNQRDGERLLKKGPHRNPVTEMVDLRLKGVPVAFDRKINAGDDWLRGLTVTVRNASSKPIVYLGLDIKLFGGNDAEEANGKPPFIYPLSYGDFHGTDPGREPDAAPTAQPVEPGSTLDITLTDEEYDSLIITLASADYPVKMRHAELTVADIIFADGTRWYKGMNLRRDPENPREWINVKEVGKNPKDDKRRAAAGGRSPDGAKAPFFLAGYRPGGAFTLAANFLPPMPARGAARQAP